MEKIGFGIAFLCCAASNSASWQWVAGTGTDATPFLGFLIYYAISEIYGTANYIKKYLPELRNLLVSWFLSF